MEGQRADRALHCHTHQNPRLSHRREPSAPLLCSLGTTHYCLPPPSYPSTHPGLSSSLSHVPRAPGRLQLNVNIPETSNSPPFLTQPSLLPNFILWAVSVSCCSCKSDTSVILATSLVSALTCSCQGWRLPSLQPTLQPLKSFPSPQSPPSALTWALLSLQLQHGSSYPLPAHSHPPQTTTALLTPLPHPSSLEQPPHSSHGLIFCTGLLPSIS